MAAGIVVVELLMVFGLAICLLHKYGNWRRQHVIVSLATLIAWYFAFVIVFLLPLDVVLTFFKRCQRNAEASVGNSTQNFTAIPFSTISTCRQPASYIPREALLNLWEVVYWTSQILTWVVLPVMQSYCKAGDFSPIGKLKFALFENAIYYGSYLLIFGVLLIYVAAKGVSLSGQNLKTICITASNTWGLFWLVLLSGYGLVEVPRQIWLASLKGYSMQKTYFDVEKLATEKNDAEETLRDCYRDAKISLESVRDANRLRPCVETIMEKFPDALSNRLSRRVESSTTYRVSASEVANMPSEKSLVRLHKRVIDALRVNNRCEAQWEALISGALHLEDVARNETNADKIFLRTDRKRAGLIEGFICSPKIEWYWECVIKRPLLKVFGAFCALMSVFIVWSEVTFFSVTPTLSLAAVFVHLAAQNSAYDYIEFSSIVTILYMCVCAYYTVFRIRIYRYYHLDPHHHTDENSLLFSAILLCRLTPPLCLNFLGLIHMDSHVTKETDSVETAYTSFMGHLDVIPFIASGFNVYFPMAILLLCLATYFRLGTRMLHYIGIEQFIGDDEMTSELVQGGKALVSAERNKIQRESDRAERDEFWREKLSDHDPSKPLRRNFGGEKRSFPGGSVSHSNSLGDRALIVENAEPIATVNDVSLNDPNNWFSNSGGVGGTSRSSAANPTRGIFDDL